MDMNQKFVVQSHSKDGKKLKKMDFDLIDLNKNSIIKEYLPSITTGVGCGIMVCYFDDIFLLGGVFHSMDVNQKSEDPHFHLHLGASLYSARDRNWKSINLLHNRTKPNVAVISGKMYCFGAVYLKPEMLDFEGNWKKLQLPPELEGRRHTVSDPVIVDHEKSRILVHVADLDQLYAFCPPKEHSSIGGYTGGTWSRITEFNGWCCVTGVTDDLLCFHEWHYENLLCVYDMRSNKWVKVVADLSRVKITICEFDRLFTVPKGNGLMCLVSEMPIRPVAIKDPPSLHFLRFFLLRSIDNPEEVVNLTAFDYQIHPIQTAGSVKDFVMLPN